jgi:AraC-like DNA-binding protein
MTKDALSDILGAVKLRGSIYFRTEFSSPWGVAVPSYKNVARFHLVARGECWVRVEGVEAPVRLGQGDLIVIPHGAAHILADQPKGSAPSVDQVVEDSGFTGEGALVLGGPDTGNATAMLCGHFEFDDDTAHPLLEALPPFIHVTGSETLNQTWLESIMKFATSESQSDRPGSDAIVYRLSEIIFIQAIRIHVERTGEASGSLAGITDPRVGRALGAIHADPVSHWTVEALGREAGMSRTAFAERFRRLIGMSPLAYVTQWRLQHARRHLLESDASIRHVAERAGYGSEAAFIRAYKKHYGATPAAMRRAGR